MSLGYAWEKLHIAVAFMATSTAPLQERLADAYLYGFHTIGLGLKEDLPPELQQQYLSIKQQLTSVPATGDEGTVLATTRMMPDDKAARLINEIVSLYDDVARLHGKTD